MSDKSHEGYPYDTYLIDPGNAFTKALYLSGSGGAGERLVTFSSVVAMLGTRPPDIPASYDPERGEGFIFRYAGRYWAVGKVAESLGGQRVTGTDRYTKETWQALVAGAVTALAGESGTANLVVAMPMLGGKAAESAIKTNLQQVFQVRLYSPTASGNAGQRTIQIKAVKTEHEAKGAYFYHLLTAEGQPRPNAYYARLHPSFRGWDDLKKYGAIICDMGGLSLDILTIFQMQPVFEYSRTIRERVGLNRAMGWFQDSLQSHPVVGGMGDRPDVVLRQALVPVYTKTGKPKFLIQFGQKQVDVSTCVREAMEPLCKAISLYIMQSLDGAADYNYIILTGGGAEAIYPWLPEYLDTTAKELGVTNHAIVLRPDTDYAPFLHNVEGMRRAVLQSRSKFGR